MVNAAQESPAKIPTDIEIHLQQQHLTKPAAPVSVLWVKRVPCTHSVLWDYLGTAEFLGFDLSQIPNLH